MEAWASLGTDETDRRSVIAGGVTAANFPHLFKNSRRASESSRPSGNSGEPLTEASNQDVTRGPILSRLQLSDIATKAVAIPRLLRLTNLLMLALPSQLTRTSSQARGPPKVPRISDQYGRPKAVNTSAPLSLPSVSQSPSRSGSTPRQGAPLFAIGQPTRPTNHQRFPSQFPGHRWT